MLTKTGWTTFGPCCFHNYDSLNILWVCVIQRKPKTLTYCPTLSSGEAALKFVYSIKSRETNIFSV